VRVSRRRPVASGRSIIILGLNCELRLEARLTVTGGHGRRRRRRRRVWISQPAVVSSLTEAGTTFDLITRLICLRGRLFVKVRLESHKYSYYYYYCYILLHRGLPTCYYIRCPLSALCLLRARGRAACGLPAAGFGRQYTSDLLVYLFVVTYITTL